MCVSDVCQKMTCTDRCISFEVWNQRHLENRCVLYDDRLRIDFHAGHRLKDGGAEKQIIS